VNFFKREAVCLIRFKRSNGPSSIQCAITQVDSQSVLNHLGVALANGTYRLLASTSNQFLVERKVDLARCHHLKILRREWRRKHPRPEPKRVLAPALARRDHPAPTIRTIEASATGP
jgi:hypothetical protein